MAKYAVIDIGTNSIKLHIAEKNPMGNWIEILDTAIISRLGAGLQMTAGITPAAMKRNITALVGIMNTVHQHEVKHIIAVGTMGLRTAKNAQEFVRRVKEQCSLDIEIVSGKEEARLAYLAVTSSIALQPGKQIIFDTGGGSTEFIFGKDGQIEQCFSLNVGAVQYTEQMLVSDPVTDDELSHARTAIENDLADLRFNENICMLIGIGGTVTNLSAVKHQLTKYDPSVIQGSRLTLVEIERQIALYQSKTLEDRKKIVGLQPKRADVILAGALIVSAIMKKASIDTCFVSDRGLRHGLLVDRFGEQVTKRLT